MARANGALLALVLAMALWGSSFIALKLAFAELPALWVIAARMLIGAGLFALALRWRGEMRYQPGDWKYLLGLTLCEPCLYFIFEAWALQNTSAAQAGMITALLPLLVAIGAYMLLGERVSRMTLLGFGLAIAGAVWLSLAGDAQEGAPNPLLGNAFEFLAMLCATGYTLLLKHLSSRYSTFLLTALQAFAGTLFFTPLAFWLEPSPAVPGWQGGLAVIYLGTLVTVGAYGLFNYAVARLPASQAAAWVNLIPVFTLIFAVTLLGERLSGAQILAAGLVFAGLALSQWRSQAPAPAGILD